MSVENQTPRSQKPLATPLSGGQVEPIRWRGDRLELLDQRLLPDRTEYLTCRNAEEVARAIKDMVVRGAPAIGCAAAFGVVLSKGAPEAYEVLAKSRPTAVNLFWALERMKIAQDLEKEAIAIFEEPQVDVTERERERHPQPDDTWRNLHRLAGFRPVVELVENLFSYAGCYHAGLFGVGRYSCA